MLKEECPSCGSEIVFEQKLSIYTVCSTCGMGAVRQDVNVEALGKVADLQEDGTPIVLAASGRFRSHRFRVVGRIQRGYARGFWNEWVLAFDNGSTGWLSEAMGFYSVLFDIKEKFAVPDRKSLQLGQQYTVDGRRLWVKSMLEGEVVGAEGELPVKIQGQEKGLYVDLTGEKKRCASISYVDPEPRVAAGVYAKWTDFHFTDLPSPEGW